jgi:hypothetical protein
MSLRAEWDGVSTGDQNGSMEEAPILDFEPIALDRILVPLDSVARPVRDEQVTILKPERLGEDGMGPVLHSSQCAVSVTRIKCAATSG